MLWGILRGLGSISACQGGLELAVPLATKVLGPHGDRLHPQLYPNALSSERRVTAVSKAPRCPSVLEQAEGWYKAADSSNLAFLTTNTASPCQALHKSALRRLRHSPGAGGPPGLPGTPGLREMGTAVQRGGEQEELSEPLGKRKAALWDGQR